MMCAQHALNAILQGHFYDPSQLAQIANELAEHQCVELGIAMGDIEQNFHVDQTGFFSVEVIERAFKAWDMSLVRWRPCRALASRYDRPEREFAFLLNLESHWIALRGFGRHLRFNLNSYFDKPQWIGDAYLSTFLEQLARENYTVFVVEPQGDMPPPETIADDLAEASLASLQSEELDLDPHDEEEDEELQRAIRESLADSGSQNAPSFPISTRRRTRQEHSSSDEDKSQAPGLSRADNTTTDPCIQLPPSGRRTQRKYGRLDSPNTSVDNCLSKTTRRSRNKHSPPSASLDEDLSYYSTNTHSSPFLHPVASLPMENVDDDVLELSDTESADGNLRTDPNDIDDEQMQAVIAASLGQDYSISQRVLDGTRRALRSGSFDQPEENTQVPEDVERIRRLREFARRDAETVTDQTDSAQGREFTFGPEHSDVDEEEKPANPSPEEMRRLRLARFG